MTKKVAVVIPSAMSSFSLKTFYSFIYAYSFLIKNMDNLPFKMTLHIIAPTAFPIDANRNMAVGELLDDGYDTSLWVDGDQVLPMNLFFKLLTHPHPIVSGMYFLKKIPYYPVCFRQSPGDKDFLWFQSTLEYPQDDLFYVDMVGMGAIKIDCCVFQEIAKTYNGKKPEFFKYGINPVKVAEMDHHIDDQQKKINRLREKYLIRDVSEDVYFWKQVREKTNYKIVIDPTLKVGHMTDLNVDEGLARSFYNNSMDIFKQQNPEAFEDLMEKICRAEPINREN